MASTTPTLSQTPTGTSATSTASCVSAVPGQYGNVPISACNSYYNFDPQFSPAVASAVIFGLLTLVHIVLGVLYKKAYTWVVTMGALWETAGFVLGALGAHDQQNINYSILHTIIILLAPLWINAFVYMTLSRMVHMMVPEQRVLGIKSTLMSKLFVGADIVTFLVQAVGGSMATPGASSDTVLNGLHIYMVGIGLQELCIVVFIVLMVLFHRNTAALEASSGYGRVNLTDAEVTGPRATHRGWKWVIYGMYAVLALITTRIIYRMCEYAGGFSDSNPIPFHEIYSYVLDALPMMLALLLLAVLHPGRVLQGPNSDFREHKAAKKAAKAARKEEKYAAKEAGRYGRGTFVGYENYSAVVPMTTPAGHANDEYGAGHESGHTDSTDRGSGYGGRVSYAQ